MECQHFFKLVELIRYFKFKIHAYTYGCTRCDERMTFYKNF